MIKPSAGLIWVSSLLLLCAIPALRAQGDPPRTVCVIIAVDKAIGNRHVWNAEARPYLNECIGVFKREFGINLDLRELVYWCPTSAGTTLSEAMCELRNQVQPAGCDLVLGIISPGRTTGSEYGMASYFNGDVLLRNRPSKIAMKGALLHELCHIFGAADLHERNSIMSTIDPGFELDPFTRQAVLLHKFRLFDRLSFPVPKEKIEEAIALYRVRAALGLGESGVELNLGLLYLEKKDFAGALNTFQKIARINPDFLGIHNILGSVYLGSGRVEQAIIEFERALEHQPGHPDIHYNLGQAYFKKRNVEAAEAEYKKALEANPAYSPAHLSLAYLYLLTRRLDAAVSECAAALKASPGLGEASCMLACALLLRSEPVLLAAVAAGEGEWDLDLLDIEASRRAEGGIQEAIALCQMAISISPGIPEAHNTLGAALAYQKKFAEAEAEFLRAREIKSDYQEAHYNLAFLYYTQGETEKAAQHIRRVLEINPGSGLGRQILDRILLGQTAYAIFARMNKE